MMNDQPTKDDIPPAPPPPRSALPPNDCWDLDSLYADEAAWEADFEGVEQRIVAVEALRGTLDCAAAAARLFQAEAALNRLLEKVYTYAHLRADEDTSAAIGQARLDRVRALLARAGARLAWIEPELLSRDAAELRAWIEAPELAAERYAMTCLLRNKPHVLSAPEERLLARAAELLSAPARTFSLLNDADLRFPSVRDERNRPVELTHGRYHTFLTSRDRRVRKEAFAALFDTYGAFRNTLAGTLSAQVKAHNFQAEVRGFPSALEAALHPDHIPATLYQALIDAVRAALPRYHRYLDLRRRRLGLATLDMYDLHVPLADTCERIPYQQARDWILASCEPLGEAYVEDLERAFDERWIDRLENRGKRSGAYSSGCYDSKPYILMTYQGRMEDVFTLAHELGHSMHSLLSRRAQPPRYARYAIFVAEIASTLNEALLLDYLLNLPGGESGRRAYLLSRCCDAFKSTVYRQTQFAEFERFIHQQDAAGQPLTAAFLDEAYGRLNRTCQGPSVEPDPRIAVEWARIPHFYYRFYVYKYATSFCAAQVLLPRLLAGDAGQRDRYLDLLRAGGSADPLELVRRAGVDLSAPEAYETAFKAFDQAIDALDDGPA